MSSPSSGSSDSQKALEKAFFEIDDAGARKGEKISVMFNPATLSINRANSWKDAKQGGKGVQTARFKGMGAASMSMELEFDTTDTGAPVTDYTDKITGLLQLDSDVPGTSENTNNARPPVVKFHWGTTVFFPAVVQDAGLTLTYFASNGVPLRAKVTLKLMEYALPLPATNPTSGTPFPHRVHRTLPGETLDRISAHYYGDSNKWRSLASANGIEDPLAIRPGSLLVIPEITSL